MPIYSVLDELELDQLGRTSMHEHVLIDARVWHSPPREASPADTAITMENLGFVRWNCESSEDNLVLDDPNLAITEIAAITKHGGSAIVDLTVDGIGRRVSELPEISRQTGVQIIIGCGYYVHPSHPDWLDAATADDIAEKLLTELCVGIDGTTIRAGLVGEIGTSEQLTEREARVVRAAGVAGAKTGAAVNIHLDPGGAEALSILDILVEEGMPADRVIFSHMDERLDHGYHVAVAQSGAVVEFDTFGSEAYTTDDIKNSTDADRCEQLARMIDEGYSSQLVLGCDVWMKILLRRYGGMGYDHLLKRIVPLLSRKYGVSDLVIDEMLVTTPRRLVNRPNIASGGMA